MLATVSRYSTMLDAHIVRAKLAWAGIPAFVADEHLVTMQWLYSNAVGGVRLQVPSYFKEQALTVLNEDWSEELAEIFALEKQTCLKCGSHEVEFFQFGRRAAFVFILLLDFPLLPLSDGIKCQSCGAKTKL